MNLTFWLKTALHRVSPGGFGYTRGLKGHKDAEYQHARDKHPLRNKHNKGDGWKEDKKGEVTYREYGAPLG